MTAMTTRRRGPALLAAVIVVFGGCGGSVPLASSSPPPATTQPPPASPPPSAKISPSAPPSAPPTARTAAGTITAITTQRGFIDDVRANRGDGFFAGGSVRTDAKGSLQLTLNQKIQRCTLLTKTKVTVQPSADVLLAYDSGSAVCVTTTDGGTVKLGAGTNVEIRMSDPLFTVTVEPDQTRIRVVSGLVEVHSTETDITEFLGPFNRSDVFPGGGPTEPDRWGTEELDRPTRDTVNKERNDLPKIDFTMPDPGGSAVLARIVNQGTLVLGIDERVAADRTSLDFVGWLNEFQTDNWAVDRSTDRLSTVDDGLRALDAGAIDLFVSPDAVDGYGQIPFFDDGQGRRVWLLYQPDDPVFGEAERAFVRNTVIRGTYGSQYREFFGAEAPYSAVAELFGLN